MAPRTWSLQAYLAYARGGAALVGTAPAGGWARPGRGPLIWAHVGGPAQGRAIVNLCCRIQQQRPEVQVLLSGTDCAPPGMRTVELPAEKLSDCEAFAATLRPDVCLWGNDLLRPALLGAVQQGGARLIALPPPEGFWHCPVPRWLPDPTGAAMALFDRIHAPDQASARALRRLGVQSDLIAVSGPLVDTGTPLDCDDSEHEALAQVLAGRPVWLAARVRPDEAMDILRAHRRAVRLAHRLLLILVPATDSDFETIARIVASEQLRHCNWDAGETPDDNTMVMLAEGPEELGLWYRAAPLAFLGGSLTPGHGGTDPFEAAALGTAILYGPNVSAHLNSYSRLVEAGAARIVRDADSLATAVTNCVAPDQAATMAHAGWDLVSSGAELIDSVIADVFDRLDAPRREPA